MMQTRTGESIPFLAMKEYLKVIEPHRVVFG